ncbi:MAG: shikimate dehydrogenase [Desulfovibrio sp.]|jgi:shikimate dehydrogenase|nr:shikimate dehydrogenase [Desulfovibrio sp.]
MPTALYGVAGWPLGQTLSPLLHNTGFQALGLPAVYLRWAIPPEGLAAFADSMRLLDIQGASITIPHKIALMPLLDSVSEQSRMAGAVNTVCRDGKKLCGENTDVTGFLCPLAQFDAKNTDVLLLGAGGAARAAAAGLALRRFRRIFVATPSDRSHMPLAERFGCIPLTWKNRHDIQADLVVNATPLGMRGKHMTETPFDFEKTVRPHGNRTLTAYDMVYNPLETRFLREARSAGWNCISGLSMFLGQGAAQFRLWTGKKLPLRAVGAVKAELCASEKIPAEYLRRRIAAGNRICPNGGNPYV